MFDTVWFFAHFGVVLMEIAVNPAPLQIDDRSRALISVGRRRVLEGYVNSAYGAYRAYNGEDAASAVATLDALYDGLVYRFERAIAEVGTPPDEQETALLIFLLSVCSQYFSLRTLRTESLRWGEWLLAHSLAHGWFVDGTLFIQISKGYGETGQYEQQIAFTNAALANPAFVVETPVAVKMRAVFHQLLSGAYQQIGQADQALDHADKSYQLLLAVDPDHHGGIALVAHSAATILFGMRRFDQAHSMAALSVHHAVKAGDPHQLASNMLMLAQSYTALGQLENAVQFYEAGIEFFEHIGDDSNCAHALYMYAVHQMRAGAVEQAHVLATRSRILYQRHQITDGLALTDALFAHLNMLTHSASGI